MFETAGTAISKTRIVIAIAKTPSVIATCLSFKLFEIVLWGIIIINGCLFYLMIIVKYMIAIVDYMLLNSYCNARFFPFSKTASFSLGKTFSCLSYLSSALKNHGQSVLL